MYAAEKIRMFWEDSGISDPVTNQDIENAYAYHIQASTYHHTLPLAAFPKAPSNISNGKSYIEMA